MKNPTAPFRFVRHATLAAAMLALGACATYSPKPLDLAATGKTSLADLRHDGALPERLTPDDVVRLALDNNPDLVAVRAQHGIAQAQLRTAGILPNPVLSGSYANLLSGPGEMAAIAAGLTMDLKSIVTFSAKHHAADATAQSVDATVLWQEWQTIGKARLAAVDLIEGDRQLALLRRNAELWHERLQRNQQALKQGDTTLATLAPDLAAGSDAQKQLDDFERAQQTRRRDLNLLLGLDPAVKLQLADEATLPAIDVAAVRAQLPDLANRRPDLIALQLGYRAQEEKVWASVLAQFPLFSIGPTYGRDTSNVRTLGPQITMDLPIFDRNQGNISQEHATREQLHAEFEARLIAAKSEVEAMLADQALLQKQLETKRTMLAQMEPMAAHVQTAFRQGDIDERSYVDLIASRNAKQQEILALHLTMLEQQVALATLVGAGMPHAEMPGAQTSSKQEQP
ncbi:TolC family protein [Rudaea sp.]|uniref:TolC family protein n=1 Tax=Rudaea sp. TaxID=2136325 RepID=UPI002ED58C64